jgi:hypothetical protein
VQRDHRRQQDQNQFKRLDRVHTCSPGERR